MTKTYPAALVSDIRRRVDGDVGYADFVIDSQRVRVQTKKGDAERYTFDGDCLVCETDAAVTAIEAKIAVSKAREAARPKVEVEVLHGTPKQIAYAQSIISANGLRVREMRAKIAAEVAAEVAITIKEDPAEMTRDCLDRAARVQSLLTGTGEPYAVFWIETVSSGDCIDYILDGRSQARLFAAAS